MTKDNTPSPFGVKIETVESMPKNEAWFVDGEVAKRWKEADRLYRFRWWSPIAWFRLYRAKREVKRHAKAIVKNIGRDKS